ncbi:dipeptide epimerase [soil metagenome]
MNVTTEVLRLALRDPFRIARHQPDQVATTVITEIDLAGLHGLGEAYPVAYYGETTGTVGAIVPLLAKAIGRLGDPPANVPDALAWLRRATEAMEAVVGRHGAAKAGLDIALHDLIARGQGLPLNELLGTPAKIPPNDFSIGLDEPATVAARATRASRFPALKIKLGGPSDLDTLEQVRAVYDGPIRVDANTGWEPEAALRLLPELERLGVELIEQPFPARALPRLRWLQERSTLPIVADESCETEADLEALAGVVAGVNVKLMKCGGVGPALRMMKRARELGFKVMLGCMEETSVGIAAGAAIAGLADWVDLDGNLLLAGDPFGGSELDESCRWVIGRGPGLGVERVEKSVDKLVD